MKNFILILILILPIFNSTVFAIDGKSNDIKVETQNNNVVLKEPEEFQKIIDEYKEYVAKVSPTIRDEIITYRKEIAKINIDKKMLYKKLSQESQEYLKKEQEFKKKLPMNELGLINSEATTNKNDVK